MKLNSMARMSEIASPIKNSRFGTPPSKQRTIGKKQAKQGTKKIVRKTRKSRNHLSTKHTTACLLNQWRNRWNIRQCGNKEGANKR